MFNQTLTLLFSIWMFIPLKTVSQTLWDIDKNKDGIAVYTKVENGSYFKSFKAIMSVDATMADIVELLKDVDGYTDWYGFTKTAKLLKQNKETQYNYVETTFPWPFSNRDMVYKMSIDTSSPEEVVISLAGIPDYIPEKKGIVRMKKAEGSISLRSIDGNTEITYVFHSEPGDNIPVWLANSSIAELPFKTLHGLRRILNENR